MARDPSRRFSFGITVEHTNTRLWFCSRGTPVVSKSFDFMTVCPLPLPHVWVINSAKQNLPLLLHVFLSLAFASKEALGWDPTVQLVTVKGGKRVYRIDVGGQSYETEEVLSDDVAEELVGHATRVWTVSRPGSHELFVLKDVWVEDGSSLEHAINEAILRDAEIRYGTSVRNELASHLLTPVASWLVSFNGEEDHTTNVMMRGYSPSFRDIVKVDVRRLRTANNDGTAIVSSTPRYNMRAPFPWHNPARQVLGRKHYRIVFKEVARAIDAIERPADVFVVLSELQKVRSPLVCVSACGSDQHTASPALKWIHRCGWVHRDLSAGNLYLYEGRGLIGDLEYAKCKNSDTEYELRTVSNQSDRVLSLLTSRKGTPDFMAIEAARRSYAYLPEVDEDQWAAEGRALFEGRIEDARRIQEAELCPPPFFHHDLHDLESLWWIAIWAFFHTHTVLELEAVKKRDDAYAELFSVHEWREERKMFLASKATFYGGMAWVPSRHHGVKVALNDLRSRLIRKYVEFEAAFPQIRLDVFEGTQDNFQAMFGRCIEVLETEHND